MGKLLLLGRDTFRPNSATAASTLWQVRLDVIKMQVDNRTPRLESISHSRYIDVRSFPLFMNSYALILRVAPASALGAGIHTATWSVKDGIKGGLM